MEYKPWKDALHCEVKHLNLTSAQWIELLNVRTAGEANDIIKRLRVLQFEISPEQALANACNDLDSR